MAAVGDFTAGAYRFHHRHGLREDWLRLVLIQGRMAFAAKIIDGSELDEMTMVASHHFPVFDGCESRSHLGFGSARAGHHYPMDQRSTPMIH